MKEVLVKNGGWGARKVFILTKGGVVQKCLGTPAVDINAN